LVEDTTFYAMFVILCVLGLLLYILLLNRIKKLETKIDGLLAVKVDKQNVEKEQTRKQKLLILKNDLDQLLQEERK
jgi:hypothetical protein